ncbi:hypothetical protein BJ875DRAFT_458443, partial [Amylocarpus encephaloides]
MVHDHTIGVSQLDKLYFLLFYCFIFFFTLDLGNLSDCRFFVRVGFSRGVLGGVLSILSCSRKAIGFYSFIRMRWHRWALV